MKRLSILGSTGSIGTQTLDVVRKFPNEFKVVGLSCNSNIELLKKQAEEFKPLAVCVMDKEKADTLNIDIPVYSGINGLIKLAKLQEADIVLNSLVGSVGVKPTIEAARNFKNIALANKETLVTAGSIVMKNVREHNVNLMPIDSEHSAIFQCLNGEDRKSVNNLTITCSGGAFRDKSKEELSLLKATDALQHPTWDMGAKITIDCATLMNKGFEVIEAHWLYGTSYDNIQVVLHPESVVHSLIEFIDNSVIAQMGAPSMKIPIQYALTYPKRLTNMELPKLNLAKIGKLNFREINNSLFPCLGYAYEAGKLGGTMPAVMNAADEVLVQAFLQDKICFLDIPKLIKRMMDEHSLIKNPSLDEIMDVDKGVKERTRKLIEEK